MDDPDVDNIYLVMQLANLGVLMDWDPEKNLFVRNEKIVEFVIKSANIDVKAYSKGKNNRNYLALH